MDTIIPLVSAALGALIGGCTTYLTEKNFRKKEKQDEKRRCAMLLRADLKSIQKYVEEQKWDIDIRYYSKWQELLLECSDLSNEDIVFVYEIYDCVYDFDRTYQVKQLKHDAVIDMAFNKAASVLIEKTYKSKQFESILEKLKNYK